VAVVFDTTFVYGLSEATKVENPTVLLGGKGAGLVAMSALGLPVPAGFVVTTEACQEYMRTGELPEGLMEEVAEHLRRLEGQTGKNFGNPEDPLLVSVRSGAAVSMPGMMDTVLNLGLNDDAAEGLARATGDGRFAYDSYRRFVQMFANVVLGVQHHRFEEALQALKDERGASGDSDLLVPDLRTLVTTYKEIVERRAECSFPEDPQEQLEMAVKAVFDSWSNARAIAYRKEFGIPDSLGTAVTVQAMVFGNMGEDSATGVAFTRDPSTGEQGLFGEFLLDAQGEDVVAGIRTPRPLAEMEGALPRAFSGLLETMALLEREYRDMQDVEFTVERDKLYMLQTRTGKRTARAALKIARDMAEEGLISREEAVMRLNPSQIDQLLHPTLDPEADFEVACRGLGASPGAATGRIVLTANEAAEMGRAGEAVILVRKETDPDDVHGMIAARGVLTATGGMTSHAAVVARGMGKPAVTGCSALEVAPDAGEIVLAGKKLKAGEVVTIEGSSGIVAVGEVPLVEADPGDDFAEVLSWADGFRAMGVRANADTPEDARRARELGAEGIGLCRTEHMFMEDGRLEIVRRMILAENEEASEEALSELEPLQRQDFEGICREMDALPVTVRLLDPPLHEFLPNSWEVREELRALERFDGTSEKARELRRRLRAVENLEEKNPMLGLRGVRLGITKPEVYRMQARAIAEAVRAEREAGRSPVVEVMVPLVGFPEELGRTRRAVEESVAEVLGEGAFSGEDAVKIGTMIELPRACVVADEIAPYADFFSFGTNDLTQTTLGFSRDDAEGKFLSEYLEKGIVEENPFERLDLRGVGRLISAACESGRGANPDLKLGVCGEHGGDPESVAFFHGAGLDYVSCSPYRLPVARLAAARAAIGAEVPPTGARGEVVPDALTGVTSR
jgi:pyruvate,orthophosphate dikinase